MTTTATEPSTAAEPEKDNKKVIIGAGVAGALVLGFLGYHLAFSGGGGQDDAFVAPVKHVAPKVIAPAAKAPAKRVVKAVVPVASTVKLGRDPFLALYSVPVAAPAAATTGSTTPTTTTGSTTNGSTSGSSASTTPSSSPYALKLTSIRGTDAKLYTFSVAGTSKTVLAAQRFGKYGELVVLAYVKDAKGNPIGALIQVGDDDPVGVKVGEKITVL